MQVINSLAVIKLLFLLVVTTASEACNVSPKIAFWDQAKKGANIFNKSISSEIIHAAKQYNIQFIRLAPDKFKSKKRDFLIGSVDNYQGLVEEDLKVVLEHLDECHRQGIPVVLTMLSLPGSRWKQNNDNKDDLRLWEQENYQKQAAQFWQDLAARLKDHPAIVGYNILNEPHPERLYEGSLSAKREIHQEQIQKFLNTFYSRVVIAIRQVDPHTPILIDSSAYADPKHFRLLMPIDDPNILYAFHMYEPYSYTNKKINRGRFSFPGMIDGLFWDKDQLDNYLVEVKKFQKRHNIPSNRIIAGEFGGHRTHKGLSSYLRFLIEIFDEQGWHWAIYAFREDTWDGMDYELGTQKLPWSYWRAVEQGLQPPLHRSDKNHLMHLLTKAWQKL